VPEAEQEAAEQSAFDDRGVLLGERLIRRAPRCAQREIDQITAAGELEGDVVEPFRLGKDCAHAEKGQGAEDDAAHTLCPVRAANPSARDFATAVRTTMTKLVPGLGRRRWRWRRHIARRMVRVAFHPAYSIRIGGVAQSVAHEIEGQHDDDDRHHGAASARDRVATT